MSIWRTIILHILLSLRTWEKGYQPHWKEKSLLTWAASINNDNEHLVRTLAGKHTGNAVTELDLYRAKETIRQYCAVGLTDAMEESVRRFNLIMGISTEDDVNYDGNAKQCMDGFFGGSGNHAGEKEAVGSGGGGGMKKLNSNPHPIVSYW